MRSRKLLFFVGRDEGVGGSNCFGRKRYKRFVSKHTLSMQWRRRFVTPRIFEFYFLRPKIFASFDFCASRLTIRLIKKNMKYYLFCYDMLYHHIYFKYIILFLYFHKIFK
jgi:hypothetical protein